MMKDVTTMTRMMVMTMMMTMMMVGGGRRGRRRGGKRERGAPSLQNEDPTPQDDWEKRGNM
eukprot:543746-Pyramimonas_sp.AAC.1